jgi:primosomal protein N' (replication factor Y) (superfamily II helicase)
MVAPALNDLIDVAVPMPVYRTYTYRVPRELGGTVKIGMRVLVPFKRRQVTAYVLGPGSPLPETIAAKPIADVLDSAPLFPDCMVPFLRWTADYYLHPIGEVIQTALPGGLTVEERSLYRLTDAGRRELSQKDLDAATDRMLRCMDASGRRFAQLRREGGQDFSRARLNSWMEKGWVARHTVFKSERIGPKMQRFVALSSVDENRGRLSPQRRKIVEFIQKHGPQPVAALKAVVPTAPGLVRAMIRDSQAVFEERRVYRDPLGAPITPDRAPELTHEQRAAVETIGRAIGKGFQAFLLSGVTGSGKTEVYLQLAAGALSQGRAVIVLVPEIALISQMERAFRARFGERIALLHSALSDGERYDQWRRIRRGDIHIAIGARSAVFAPFERIGLIIVDEEHDDSYKQEGALRYNARDLAVVRARMDDAPAVLGSATPSVQSAYNAQLGKYRQVSLLERVDRRALPEITVQDLTRFREEQGLRRFLTPPLMAAVQETLDSGEQALLFLNRRGFASALVCAACGQPLRCDRCDISLTYHRQINAYLCHHCGFSKAGTSRCNRCGSSKIKRLGVGTEKLEAEIQKRFPQARVARMDRDTTRRRGQTVKLLKALRERRIDILVGTQMVAKGHDYPHITLVGIICADLSLSMPDFRAGERTFQILAQVAGRAGRGETPGRVILQTYNPGHFSIEAARHQDYGAFYRQEIEFRKALGYPPFARMIQLRISGRDPKRTAAHARHLGDQCRQLLQAGPAYAGLQIMGPIEAPLVRIADQYRWQLLVKGGRVQQLHAFVRELLFGPPAPARIPDVVVAVDVDPLFLM